jgi:hypothetical protein
MLRRHVPAFGGVDVKHGIGLARVAVAGIAAVVAVAGSTAPAHAGKQQPDVPAAIEVPDGNKVFLVGHAVGVQIYRCDATPTGFAWALVAPRADLYGDNGKVVATHFGGPTWQARDGSRVVAQRADGVTVDATAIPWLLLSTVDTSAGADGDRLTRTTFIQRTATTGGLAPATGGCNAATAGTSVEVPYTADYHFWKATGR